MKLLEQFREKHKAQMEEISLTLHLIKTNKTTLIGLVIVSVFVFLAIFAPWLLMYPDDIGPVTHPKDRLLPPTWRHPFGTDSMGRDLFTRIVFGSRISLFIGLSIVSGGAVLGVSLGLLSGFFGGKIDELIMRVTDVFLALPTLLLGILISVALGRRIETVIFALSFTWWGSYARLTRGVVLSIKEETYIEAARLVGSSNLRIMFRHILPNSMSPIIIKTTLGIGRAILFAASLGFLGVGAPPPTPEWGLIISESRFYLPNWWWYGFFPGLVMALVVLGFMLLGDGIRDIMDPKLRGQ